MAAVMDNVDVLNQMAAYDFNSPIDVTMIFEDSDNEETFKSVLRERDNINNDNINKQAAVENLESEYSNNDKSSEKINNQEDLKKKRKTMRKVAEEICKNILNDAENVKRINTNNTEPVLNKSASHQHSLISKEATIENYEKSVPLIQISENEQVTFIEDLLNTVSEHLILIMKSCYHYGIRRKTSDPSTKQKHDDNRRIFNFIQSHFFELSYRTVETIILPQEHNCMFMNHFLDNTVLLANNKRKWKCHRGHVLPFLNELIRWSKQKQARIKTFGLQPPSNDNMSVLKSHLIRPSQPSNLPVVTSAPTNHSTTTSNEPNDVCIFSVGSPGNEITINIHPDTLINYTQKQYSNTVERTGNQNNVASSVAPTTKTTSFAPSYGNPVNNMQNNNIYYHRPPPPYKMNSKSSKNLIHNQNQNYQHIGNPIQNFQQPNQYHQNIGQTIPGQMQYLNMNQTSPPHNYLSSHDNIYINNQMQGTHEKGTSGPMMTSITSNIIVRCCICGKNTSTTTCSPYTSPCRPTYCSYLCQELDHEIHKSTYSNT